MDGTAVPSIKTKSLTEERKILSDKTILYPPQWIQCDLRYLDMTVLGKSCFSYSSIRNNITLIFIKECM